MDLALQKTHQSNYRKIDNCIIDVSIVIPCLNESETIEAVVKNARSALIKMNSEFGLSGEVVVADNGSTDGSVRIAEMAGARVEAIEAKGYGSAIRGGVAGSTGRFIVMGDADGAHNFYDAVPMIGKLLSGTEVCMGSRFKGHITPGSIPFWNRYLGNPLLTGVLNFLFRSGMSDAHCGLRAFTRSAFKKLNLNSSGMEFASEMLIKSSLLGLRTSEVPITQYMDGRTREPHLRPIRDGWRHLKYMLLLAPTWMFMAPFFFFGILAVFVYSVLLQAESGSTRAIWGVTFGDHWVIVASIFASFAHTLYLAGCTSYFYSVSRGYRKFTQNTHFLKKICRLEPMLLQGLCCILFSFILAVSIFSDWRVQDFQNLNAIRPLSLAGVLALIGFQHCSGAFLVNIVDEE